jgi:hypothetical protein
MATGPSGNVSLTIPGTWKDARLRMGISVPCPTIVLGDDLRLRAAGKAPGNRPETLICVHRRNDPDVR